MPRKFVDPKNRGQLKALFHAHNLGSVLPWAEWQHLAEQIRSKHVAFLKEPEIILAGTPEEQTKFYLEDPSNNVIEIKAYRNFNITLRQEGLS